MALLNMEIVFSAIKTGAIEWHRHALERMMERGITRRQVMDVILNGAVIEDYPDDYPYPSILIYGKPAGIPLHVVAAFDKDSNMLYIITSYVPDMIHFMDDYKTRRP